MKKKIINGLKHYVITEVNGKEIKGGMFKRFEISEYWQMNLKNMQRKPTMDFIIAKNLLDLKDKIVRVDKNSVVIFDEAKDRENKIKLKTNTKDK